MPIPDRQPQPAQAAPPAVLDQHDRERGQQGEQGRRPLGGERPRHAEVEADEARKGRGGERALSRKYSAHASHAVIIMSEKTWCDMK